MDIVAETKRLILRRWREEDRSVFRAMNADPQVMAFFPGTMSAKESDAMLDRIMALPQGIGLGAIEVKSNGEIGGACGISPASVQGVVPECAMEIGWRLIPSQWGQGFAREAGEAWLTHGFTVLGLKEVYAWTAESNKRSLAVMRRCGMERTPELDFDHPLVPDSYANIRRHVVSRMTQTQWKSYQ